MRNKIIIANKTKNSYFTLIISCDLTHEEAKRNSIKWWQNFKITGKRPEGDKNHI